MSDVATQGKPKVTKAKKAEYGLATTPVRKSYQMALGAVLGPMMQPTLARQGVVLAQIAPHWRAICPLLAAHSCPEAVRGDTLTVAVASDGVKQELHYITPQIVEGINRLMGYAAIAKVRAITRYDVGVNGKVLPNGALVVGNPAPSSLPVRGADRDKAAAMCKGIKDKGLRAALGRLGAEIMKKT